jgi:hypothetical protein
MPRSFNERSMIRTRKRNDRFRSSQQIDSFLSTVHFLSTVRFPIAVLLALTRHKEMGCMIYAGKKALLFTKTFGSLPREYSSLPAVRRRFDFPRADEGGIILGMSENYRTQKQYDPPCKRATSHKFSVFHARKHCKLRDLVFQRPFRSESRNALLNRIAT